MITATLYYHGKDGAARQFAEEVQSSGLLEKIRAQEGCLRYEYFVPLEDPETLLLIDSWENQLQIDRHHASPMMQKIVKLREKYDLHMTVERYVTYEHEEDNQFIRK